jgi:hypothetical protein
VDARGEAAKLRKRSGFPHAHTTRSQKAGLARSLTRGVDQPTTHDDTGTEQYIPRPVYVILFFYVLSRIFSNIHRN